MIFIECHKLEKKNIWDKVVVKRKRWEEIIQQLFDITVCCNLRVTGSAYAANENKVQGIFNSLHHWPLFLTIF